MSERRISEKELILPTLYLAVCNGGRITTSELIKQLTAMMRPSGIDAEILSGRNDTYFSQKVRNLRSHNTLVAPGYATYEDKGYAITQLGRDFVEARMDSLRYLLSSDFDYEDVRGHLDDVTDGKVIPYDELVSEGETITMTATSHERSRKLRDAAVAHYTQDGVLKCFCCGFDFGSFYGDKYGSSCIEIHHIKPIFMYEGRSEEQTIKEALDNLMPVCPNCHRAIHRNHVMCDELPDFIAAIKASRKF